MVFENAIEAGLTIDTPQITPEIATAQAAFILLLLSVKPEAIDFERFSSTGVSFLRRTPSCANNASISAEAAESFVSFANIGCRDCAMYNEIELDVSANPSTKRVIAIRASIVRSGY